MGNREELETKIAEQRKQIEGIEAAAQQALANLNAQRSNAIGRCEGKIEMYEEELKKLTEVADAESRV